MIDTYKSRVRDPRFYALILSIMVNTAEIQPHEC